MYAINWNQSIFVMSEIFSKVKLFAGCWSLPPNPKDWQKWSCHRHVNLYHPHFLAHAQKVTKNPRKNTKKIHTLFTICCWGRRRERRKRVRKTGSQIKLRIVSRISSRRKTKIRQSLCQNKRTWRRQWRWRKIPAGCGNFL